LRHLPLIPLSASLGLLLSLPLTLKLAQAVPGPADAIMPISEIKVGMKGYGLTVFRGTEPERFDVEVLGTIRRFRPHQDLVLIKTGHPRLEVAKVVAGMSGSPVFLNGRMIGAYAYGWQFGSEPIAGVTPIQSMLDEMARRSRRTGNLLPRRRRPLRSARARAPNRIADERPDGGRARAEPHARGHPHSARWAR